MADPAAVRAAFIEQAGWCTAFGSPFTARLCTLIAERLDETSAIGRRVMVWPGNPSPDHDHVPQRLCGALHGLARSGEAPNLTALYPPASQPDLDDLWREVVAALQAFPDRIHHWLDNPPQTNEVARSAGLISGLHVIAARFGRPLSLFELGASAGLNLILDRYAYDLGGRVAGTSGSPLLLKPTWQGPPPPAADVIIAARAGVDLRPADARNDGKRILSYVWADQLARVERLETALRIAAADPPFLAQGDGADWLEHHLPDAPADNVVRVVLHSVAFQYFPAEAQARVTSLMERLGSDASEERPLAWLRFEMLPGEKLASLRLRTWPGEERLLAWCHPHGASIEWL